MPPHFTSRDLPCPRVDVEQAVVLLRDRYGLTVTAGDLRELGSQQDRNFRVAAGAETFLLKVANPAFERAELSAQMAALTALSRAGLTVPEPRAGLDGKLLQPAGPAVAEPTEEAGGASAQPLTAYLLSFLPGSQLEEGSHLAAPVVAAFGTMAGKAVAALRDLTHPGTERMIQWDLRHGSQVVADLSHHIHDPDLHRRAVTAATTASARLAPIEGRLRPAVIHGDLTGDNVVCRPQADGRAHPYAVIDLGDLHRGWLVAELAVTCASLLHHCAERPMAILPAVTAFADVVGLDVAEVAALWPLVSLRAAVLAVSSAQQLSLEPDNAYVSGQRAREETLLRAVSSVPFDVAEEVFRDALGMPPAHLPDQWPPPSAEPMVPGLAERAVPVDLSVTSDALHEGRWLLPDIEQRLAADVTARGPVAVFRWGEYRLTRSQLNSATAPATLALSVELFLRPGTAVNAPVLGVIVASSPPAGSAVDGVVTLRADGFDVIVRGLEGCLPAPAPVASGSVIGHAGAAGRVGIQVALTPGQAVPFTTPDLAAAWRRLCPDPSPLLGLDCGAKESDSKELLARRSRSFAQVQEHYYTDPPQVERGWQHHLCDTTGRSYVDMVNNVSSIGHGHPRLVRDLTRQWSVLNTNSRFHYALLTDLSERLVARAPAGLDTVLLVNSGSEAVDLALRIAWTSTGRRDVLAVEEGYHGWTMGADAVTSSVADNPNALATRPDWVHLVPAPNPYRGIHRGTGSGPAYVRDVEQVLRTMAERGRRPAAYIAEPFYGNAGGVELPPGYLAGVYSAVRAAGGLCIADEVQVGYGRLGRWFWGVEQQGVVPDIITIAKAMGNGHPIGAVLTRRDIAESLGSEGHFFSSAGGSPVSCRAALTVLEVLEDEDLQGNAERVGDHLRRRLEALAARHELIGAVHGVGLYLGVEMVRDRRTLEPATQETAGICDRLLELGVVLQPTGDRRNVLKIKPPLCISRESSDFFADQLDEVLTAGW